MLSQPNSLVVCWNHIIEQMKYISGGVEQLDSAERNQTQYNVRIFSHLPKQNSLVKNNDPPHTATCLF